MVNVERMKYWDKESGMAKDSRNMKIEFRATELPREMILFFVKKIEPFIPKLTICRKCLRYGHVAKICRATTNTCMHCTITTNHLYDKDKGCSCIHCPKNCIKSCKYCKCAEHATTDIVCPEHKNQFALKNIVFGQNKSFFKAKQMLAGNNNNNGSYASVTSLTTQMQTIMKEFENIKEQNKICLNRLNEAENLLQEIDDQN